MAETYTNSYLRSTDPHYFVDGQFYVPQGSTAATTSIQTANQLGEVNARLNAGVFGVDIAPINPQTLEQIPKEHFDEMYRLAKLSNATVSMHGPILGLAGFNQNRYDDQSRVEAERMVDYALDRAHQLSPNKSTFMNIHINNDNEAIGERWRAATKEEIEKYKGAEDDLGNPIINNTKFSVKSIKEYMGIVRSSFLIDEKEKIAKIMYKVNPEKHIEEILKLV